MPEYADPTVAAKPTPSAATLAPSPMSGEPLQGGYAAQKAALKPKTASSPFPAGTWLRWGSTGPLVRTLQTLLTAAGYSVPVTGNFLKLTMAAVKTYQVANGLTSDGVAGPVTLTRLSDSGWAPQGNGSPLGSAPSTLTGKPARKRGARGPAVVLLQKRLNHHGADIPEHGDFGPVTEAAVRAFRIANGLGNGVIVGPQTAEKLNAAVANPPITGGGNHAARAKVAVAAAREQLGVPYEFGRASPGVAFDCSGLTKYAWGQAGVTLTHQSAIQATETDEVDLDDAQAGDLLFFHSPTSHVSMVTSSGRHIQSPQLGSVVSEGAFTASKVVRVGRPRS